ncbi:cell wall hydrolase [Sandarakinorhabdus sp. AAP62]|uniref:cell wall hydrolase n=1 Tax=Sandarakinorhabdus sp. AAP62 TaxID=1248916 RepID=UPI000307373F|nr:cell wall hydrolase [Sandarakinorhabdus sp. AAP62]
MVSRGIHSIGKTAARIAALVVLALAGPALAETSLPVLPGEDDRVMAQTVAPSSAGLPALVQMVAAAPAADATDAGLASASELDCLATAVWFESRGETLEGQLAVAQAVVNRAKSGRWGKGVCGVIKAPRQFNFNASRVQRSTATFTTALAVARIAAAGLWHDIAEGAHSFHAARLNPGWRLARVARIGNHVFYR